MSISLEVWGDYACFSRPEMKVEHLSYDVMTPSAAQGPVQLSFARSVEPIYPQEVTITRVAITTETDAEKKGTEMGRKYIVLMACIAVKALFLQIWPARRLDSRKRTCPCCGRLS